MNTRLFSTTIRPTKIIETLSKQTGKPIWRILLALHHRRPVQELREVFAEHKSPPGQYTRWRQAVYEPDIAAAVDWLKSHGAAVHPDDTTGSRPPSWLVLYLIAYKIRTLDQAATTSLDLVYSHLSSAPPPVQAPLLILALITLARFNLLLPIHRLLDSFLTVPLRGRHAALYFNLFLQALACTPTRSAQSASIAVAVLKSMHARQLRLSHSTYYHLLNDRFATLQLTKFLHEQMIHEGTIPSLAHLESYLRVFAKNGIIHSATEYHHAIHAATQNHPPLPEHAAFSDDPANRANTHYLSLFDDCSSAFAFLHRLAGSPPPPSQSPSPPPPSSPPLLLPPPPPPSPSPPPPSQSPPPKELDKYAYTATLAVAARDRTVSAPALVSTFDRLTARFAPTVATHTVLIRGLLMRKSPLAAEGWDALCRSDLEMDRQAVALGAQVLTRQGRPHVAFALLEKLAGRGESEGQEETGEREREGGEEKRTRTTLTAVSINDYLVTLNRIGRPDVVFKMWDHMAELFGVPPDARTLSIVLQGARLARRLDDSLQGAIAQLALRNPFRVHREEGEDHTVLTGPSQARAAVVSVLGTPKTGLVAYRPLMWHARCPWDTAIRVFQEALVGTLDASWLAECADADLERLDERVRGSVVARAKRRSVDEDPMTGFGVRMERWVGVDWPRLGELLVRIGTVSGETESEGESEGGGRVGRASRHPGVAVTTENCRNAIMLMGLTSRAPEIPLVLAWMKEVGVVPSRPTLAVGLVFWEEVSIQAPLVERWAGRRDGGGEDGEDGGQLDGGGGELNEYEKLREWMEEWVGPENMPTPRMLADWCRKVASMRAAR